MTRVRALPILVAAYLSAAGLPAAAAPNCFRSADFAARVHPRDGSVGEDIFVAPVEAGGASCPASGARNLVGADEPGYFLWLRGRYLAMTLSTGPDEDLRIIDLATGETVLAAPIAELDARRTQREGLASFDFWKVGAAVAPRLCPAAWRKTPDSRGATAAHRIERLRFDPRDGTVGATKQTSCTLLQADMP